MWTERRLQRLFDRYNQQFWQGRLADWKVELYPPRAGGYGECNREKHCLYMVPEVCRDDFDVRATLIHEMCHAATNDDHGAPWLAELTRVEAARAPTDPVDFVVPYTQRMRDIVTSCIEYARGGEPWTVWEELEEGFGISGPEASSVGSQCKHFFDLTVAEMTRRGEREK